MGGLGRKLIQIVMHDVSAIHLFYSFPPNPPNDRVQLLRRAFQETMNDAEFLAEAKKGNSNIGPVARRGKSFVASCWHLLEPSLTCLAPDEIQFIGQSTMS